jgi:hypothetical protein
MRAFVLGVDHVIQEVDHSDELRNILLELHHEQPCDLIAEEWGQNAKKNCSTVASRLASDLGIQRLNVEMTDDLMKEAGIFDAVAKRRQYGPPDAYLDEADSKRESHWVSEIQKFGPKKRAIILCGMRHAQGLSEKLKAAGFYVTMKTLQDWEWYTDLRTAQRIEEEKAKAQR